MPAPTPGTSVDPLSPAGRSRLRQVATSFWSDTPGQLRIAAVFAVLGSLILVFLGGSAFREWSSAMSSARTDAAQLVRIQTIQNDLVKADAAAATSYLAGGAGNPELQAVYDDAIADAAHRLALPATTADDAEQLQTVIDGLTRYTGLIEQARANNRQGLQIGAAYQRQAGQVLRTEIVPALQAISDGDQDRVAAAYRTANLATVRLVVAGVLALLLLVAVQGWLARRTHRVLNAPLALATAAVLVTLVIGWITLDAAVGRARSVAEGPYAASVSLAAGRTAAFDAKAQEAFGLIARGNAASAESQALTQIHHAQTDLATAAQQGAGTRPQQDFAAWAAVHAQVRADDDGGHWRQARDLATGDSNAAFTTFDESSAQALAAQAAATNERLSGSDTALQLVGWLTVAVGLLAAAASLAGISRRLGEYR
jgi:CHASE3 domain sensor protein